MSLPGNHGSPVIEPHTIASNSNFFKLDITRSNGVDNLRLCRIGSLHYVDNDEVVGKDPVQNYLIRMDQRFEELPIGLLNCEPIGIPVRACHVIPLLHISFLFPNGMNLPSGPGLLRTQLVTS